MNVDYTFETPNDLFLLDVRDRVGRAIAKELYRTKNIEILKIDKESLKIFDRNGDRGSYVLAQNLIAKIDYLLKLEEGE